MKGEHKMTKNLFKQTNDSTIRHQILKADCELRAKGAHGRVERAEQPVDPLNASNQAQVQDDVKVGFGRTLAFTLAEVLIVIGIIGVVAALTLPNLNHATGDKETVTKVKKIYAALTDAFDRAQVIYGPAETWYNSCNKVNYVNNECSKLYYDRISEFLKVSKKCDTVIDSCFKDSDEYYLTGYAEILSDGMSLLFYANGKIAVDINGPNKGKNSYGYDLFVFDSHTNSGDYQIIYPDFNGHFGSEVCSSNCVDNGDGTCTDVEECFVPNDALSYNTAWIIENGNMDYLKLDEDGRCPNGVELDWTTHTSCN